ncbi:hypothetical protein SO802_002488 [Lithocarpus litseifolius]|uniref:Uncharacterized protein n=1 Tax=Lithocarpus litseifolius TaxID=425828 RepID=A0AAW2DZ83_9ROSI
MTPHAILSSLGIVPYRASNPSIMDVPLNGRPPIRSLTLVSRGVPVPEGILSTQPILEGMLKVALPPQHKAEEGTSSHLAFIKVEKEEQQTEVEVSDSKDEFDIFNQILSQKPPRLTTTIFLQSNPADAKELFPLQRIWVSNRVAKQAKVEQKGTEKRSDPQVEPIAWLLALMLDGGPTLANASIRDFQGGKADYVTDAVKQALLLPEDMAELQSMRRHEAVQASFRVEEITNFCHQSMKEEEGKCNAAVDTLNAAKMSVQELKKKLLEEERERKSVVATFDYAKKQARGQRVLLRNAEDQLATSRAQILALKKRLEEAEMAKVLAKKAQDQAEQDGYDLEVAKTEEALRTEVSRVCRTYCS